MLLVFSNLKKRWLWAWHTGIFKQLKTPREENMAEGTWISKGQLPNVQESGPFPDVVAGLDFRGWDTWDVLEPDVRLADNIRDFTMQGTWQRSQQIPHLHLMALLGNHSSIHFQFTVPHYLSACWKDHREKVLAEEKRKTYIYTRGVRNYNLTKLIYKWVYPLLFQKNFKPPKEK